MGVSTHYGPRTIYNQSQLLFPLPHVILSYITHFIIHVFYLRYYHLKLTRFNHLYPLGYDRSFYNVS